MRCVSFSVFTVSNKHKSTLVACSENNAKFTPFPSHVAPSGYEFPGQTRMVLPPVEWCAYTWGIPRSDTAPAEPGRSFLTLSSYSKLHATIAQGVGRRHHSVCNA